MAVDRLSVTLPSELGAELRALAETRGTTVSALISEAVEHQLRLVALDAALAEADREFGPVPAVLVEAAEAELLAARQPRRRAARRSSR